MRAAAFSALGFAVAFAALACRSHDPREGRAELQAAAPSASASTRIEAARAAITAVERELQAKRLSLPSRQRHLPRLAFGAGVLGRLRDADLQVLDDRTLAELAVLPLEEPRALLTMADGALLAIGHQAMVRWEREKPQAKATARVVLFPGAELYADAQRADVFWVLEPDGAPPRLCSYRLGAGSLSGVLTPEQTLELSGPRGGTFGVTREGVWLYVTAGRVERLAPSGARLPGLDSGNSAVPRWSLPARRVDRSLWLGEDGTLDQALVSPVFRSLRRVKGQGATYAAEVGDEGRLLALIAVTGPGPHFQLALYDPELRERGRVNLPAESPTGASDWVAVVTRNQELAVAPRAAVVAVGGPDRITIFDAQGNAILTK